MTVQVREYIDPTIGVATLDATLTVMVGSGDEKTQEAISIKPQVIITSLTLHSDGCGF